MWSRVRRLGWKDNAERRATRFRCRSVSFASDTTTPPGALLMLKDRTVLRYALFQIPDLILLALGLAATVRWWEISESVAYTIFALWIVKDAAMYPMMRVAYAGGDSVADRLSGASGSTLR